MAIGVTCPECEYSFSVRDELAGKRGKCPKCGAVFCAGAAETPAIVIGAKPRPRSAVPPAKLAPAYRPTSEEPLEAYDSAPPARGGRAARDEASSMPAWGWILVASVAIVSVAGVVGAVVMTATPAVAEEKPKKEETAAEKREIKKKESEFRAKLREREETLEGLTADVAEALRKRTIQDDLLPGIVKVLQKRGGMTAGSGTGWVCNDKQWIATNHHVIAGAEAVTVLTPDGKEHDMEGIIADDAMMDMAILKPRMPIAGVKPLRIADKNYLPRAGDPVYAAGNPANHHFTVARGCVTRVTSRTALMTEGVQTDRVMMLPPEMDPMVVEHDARIFPGNSGGPLLNDNLEVIGINTWVAFTFMPERPKTPVLSMSMASRIHHFTDDVLGKANGTVTSFSAAATRLRGIAE